MRVLHLAAKDLRALRDPRMLLFALAMPLALTFLFGMLMSDSSERAPAPVPVAWVDQDGSEASAILSGLLSANMGIELRPMGRDEADAALAGSRVAGVITVASGFGASLREGARPEVALLVADVNSGDAGVARAALSAALSRLSAAARAARASEDAAAAWRPFEDDGSAAAFFGEGLRTANELWRTPPVSLRLTSARAEGVRTPSGFAQSSPGMLVQFAIFNLMGATVALVLERQSGALRRLLTTPMSRSGIIVGKALAILVIALLQQAILVTIGQVAFGVDYFSRPLATAAVVLSFSFCLAGLGLLIGTLAKSENAATAVTLVLMSVLAALGGAWFPLEITGPAFSAIGHLLPSAWALDAFHSILLRGAGLSDVLLPAGIVFAYGLAFLGIAIWRFRFEQ